MTTRPSSRVDPPELRAVFDHLNHLHFNGRLAARLEWSDRLTRAAGKCYQGPDGAVIRVARRYIEQFPDALPGLMLHEMIHLVTRGHGAAFKAEARRCGVEPNQSFIHCQSFAPQRPLRYVYCCPVCGSEYRSRRKGQWACGTCYRQTGRRHLLRLVAAVQPPPKTRSGCGSSSRRSLAGKTSAVGNDSPSEFDNRPRGEVKPVATWKCASCGSEKDGRCKPKKCANCGGTTFTKKE